MTKSWLGSGSGFRDKGKGHHAHETSLLAVPTRLSQVMRDPCLWIAWALGLVSVQLTAVAPWSEESLCQAIFRSLLAIPMSRAAVI